MLASGRSEPSNTPFELILISGREFADKTVGRGAHAQPMPNAGTNVLALRGFGP
jgi:hypothetical protein